MRITDINTGAIQSPHDYRDIPVEAIAGAATRPDKHIEDISGLPVWHQHKIGACVGHAAAKYLQHLNHLETGNVDALSARFLYAIAKSRDGLTDEGTYPRLVASIAKDIGCALEDTVPNDTKLPYAEYTYGENEKSLPVLAFDQARKYRIGGYAFATPNVSSSLKDAIIAGHGAKLLMSVGEEWYTSKSGKKSWKEKDILPLRKPAHVISGHEVFLYGYEETSDGRDKFLFMNSWSDEWGHVGTGWFYFDEYSNNLHECITYVDIPNDVAEAVGKLPDAKTFKHRFDYDIVYGTRSSEVEALQTALMIDGVFSRDMYGELLAYKALGYYGEVTRKAVLAYQVKYNVAPAAELAQLNGRRVGMKTRAQLNKQFSN